MSIMANQTADYHGDVYQWNRTVPTDEHDTQMEYYLPNWTDLVLAALFCMLIVVTIVGNTLVIAAVITTRRLRSVTNCFVSSLAAADLLVGLAVMPPAVLLQLNGASWELGEILCDSWLSLDILLCSASILSLCAISIDRYLAVTQPLVYSRRRRSKRLAGLMIVAVWILAGAITSPPLLGCFPRATDRDSKKCTYNMDSSSYVIFSACGSFFLPMLVMLYVYGRISCVIASRHRNLETNEADKTNRRTRNATIERTKSMKIRRSECTVDGDTCERTSTEGDVTSSCKKVGIVRGHQQSCINRVARETKTAGTLAVVVGGFVACWLPFFILYLATPFVPMKLPEILMQALTWLGWINSAINPFIYAFYSADFREAFWRLTFRKCFKSQTTLNHTERKLPTPVTLRKNASRT
ncbi:PREDICTED: tyramine receptor 1-like [Polistes canadensis]|uniref:tyramine receptor 1-like n=1 Tax=Polistes canadensis TaxID=91411 RepID=UPI000718D48C|nr:PREDICTED: tyramine receptor 1-like [Polistes canadensis]XP_014616456.1 PREDICTED: tyramine receptor 1-like [Polistes canadensis]XP_014616457.1 PREDICTED: tyramine receptor 1-like [Polistes canadensis]